MSLFQQQSQQQSQQQHDPSVLTMNGKYYVTELRPSDVLFGRGSGPNDHIGNVRFRQYVSERKGQYMSTNHRLTKTKIAREIVTLIIQNDHGRFVKKVEPNELRDLGISENLDYYELVDDETIMEKAKQALRQNQTNTSNTTATGTTTTTTSTTTSSSSIGGGSSSSGRKNSNNNNNEEYDNNNNEEDEDDDDDLVPIPLSNAGGVIPRNPSIVTSSSISAVSGVSGFPNNNNNISNSISNSIRSTQTTKTSNVSNYDRRISTSSSTTVPYSNVAHPYGSNEFSISDASDAVYDLDPIPLIPSSTSIGAVGVGGVGGSRPSITTTNTNIPPSIQQQQQQQQQQQWGNNNITNNNIYRMDQMNNNNNNYNHTATTTGMMGPPSLQSSIPISTQMMNDPTNELLYGYNTTTTTAPTSNTITGVTNIDRHNHLLLVQQQLQQQQIQLQQQQNILQQEMAAAAAAAAAANAYQQQHQQHVDVQTQHHHHHAQQQQQDMLRQQQQQQQQHRPYPLSISSRRALLSQQQQQQAPFANNTNDVAAISSATTAAATTTTTTTTTTGMGDTNIDSNYSMAQLPHEDLATSYSNLRQSITIKDLEQVRKIATETTSTTNNNTPNKSSNDDDNDDNNDDDNNHHRQQHHHAQNPSMNSTNNFSMSLQHIQRSHLGSGTGRGGSPSMDDLMGSFSQMKAPSSSDEVNLNFSSLHGSSMISAQQRRMMASTETMGTIEPIGGSVADMSLMGSSTFSLFRGGNDSSAIMEDSGTTGTGTSSTAATAGSLQQRQQQLQQQQQHQQQQQQRYTTPTSTANVNSFNNSQFMNSLLTQPSIASKNSSKTSSSIESNSSFHFSDMNFFDPRKSSSLSNSMSNIVNDVRRQMDHDTTDINIHDSTSYIGGIDDNGVVDMVGSTNNIGMGISVTALPRTIGVMLEQPDDGDDAELDQMGASSMAVLETVLSSTNHKNDDEEE